MILGIVSSCRDDDKFIYTLPINNSNNTYTVKAKIVVISMTIDIRYKTKKLLRKIYCPPSFVTIWALPFNYYM